MNQRASLDPIVGRYAHLNFWGTRQRVYFEEAGVGVPLVCLHTAGAHSSQWRHLMCDERITSRFRVIAFDLPWHGKSAPAPGWEREEYKLTSDGYVEAIMQFVAGLGLASPVVMGCSMGGRVVIRLAADHGEELRAVIGLEATDRPTPWWDDSWLNSPEFARGDFCASIVSGLLAPQSPSEYRSETLWHYFQSGSDVFKGDMHFFRSDSDFANKVAAIDTQQCPVYLLTGEYDYSCQAENTHATAARIPGAKAQTMLDMGHFPMSENPAAFSTYLLPVLDEIAGTS